MESSFVPSALDSQLSEEIALSSVSFIPSSTISHPSVSIDGGALPLTLARDKGRGAGIAIFPSAFGIGADLEQQMAELAADARAVAAFDPFWRGDAGFARTDEMPRVMARMQSLDRERAARDLRAVTRWLRAEAGCRSVIALGICFGGPFALRAAADGDANGVVTWHGTALGQHLTRAAEMRGPMRLHFGGADPFVPPREVAAIRAAFAARADVQIVVHDGATHGFSHRGVPEAFQPAAERAALDAARELARALA
jgi:carboxymethylenebutenolidase